MADEPAQPFPGQPTIDEPLQPFPGRKQLKQQQDGESQGGSGSSNNMMNGYKEEGTPSQQQPHQDNTSSEPPPPGGAISRADTFDSQQLFVDAPESPVMESSSQQQSQQQHSSSSSSSHPDPKRLQLQRSAGSTLTSQSVPPPGSVLTGKQEHYLKRELLAHQTNWEVSELAHPTALQRFGAPFRSDAGEVPPSESELPLLRYIFVNHVRNFPFLDQAREKEFWQDKLQTFLESFARKGISSSEDRLEQTKRAKLAVKCTKVVELMMVSGIPTASGYEERIRFSEMEVVDRGANEAGLVVNMPSGHEINGWDVNVAGVRTVNVKRHVRKHAHAEFLLRVKRKDQDEIYVARRFGEFTKMHKRLRQELPGKVLPPLPRKNKAHSLYSGGGDDDSDDESISSMSIADSNAPSQQPLVPEEPAQGGGFRSYLSSWTGGGESKRHSRTQSRASGTSLSIPSGGSPRASMDSPAPSTRGTSPSRRASEPQHVLFREEQRVSLRAFLRNFLQNEAIANSNAMTDFLTRDPTTPTADEMADIERRKGMDERRLEEQKRFYEIASQRAKELDVHMEAFRRKVIERNGLRDLFAEIRKKKHLDDLDPEYRKFAEWLRIEVAATLYHLFLAEDNSPELFAQFKRIHSLVPYGALKQVIRFTNPAAVMTSVLDLFMAQPMGAKSLLQRIFLYAVGDGVKTLQQSIESLTARLVNEEKQGGEKNRVFCEKIRNYTYGPDEVKERIRSEAVEEKSDLLVKLLQSEEVQPELSPDQIGRAFNAYVAWDNAVTNVNEPEMRDAAELYAQLKQLLKLYTRQRDKKMMLEMVEEPNTLRLFRDLFTIFYEPLVRVYKSANVYNSVTDFASFASDAIQTIEKAQRADVSADPNQTVQSFIDLCERHKADLYKFIHEVHIHDNGLFDKLMVWIEGILDFLRNGPPSGQKLDVNALFQGSVDSGTVDKDECVREINALIKWQMARKRWHQDKTRQKMASGGTAQGDQAVAAGGPRGSAAGGGGRGSGMAGFKSSDFGINALDLQDMGLEEDQSDDEVSSDEEAEAADPIAAERKRRRKNQDLLRRNAGEPEKPKVQECYKMMPGFVEMLRMVLA
ncbi:hypothetical protein KC332_g10713 [Hortaea werneckii]|uniref:PX domain-containing protein n=2 Tax=Hortaea werneckii TaxID=91943 RepID=A0A3M7ISD9_HORWE|nr:hypothetical protein KC358_g10665 [Hortaea werneckii]KAI6817662.1 hypothetical protein KC350_g10540 [Hortaea werneckii]KAI6918524.1 hypothetical protein KC348_g10895 [Hortaea werneckii]KAI6930133.1 hypothetical protein KC341_g10427 [Hortaea werneckii]KAI6964373.1 hypothetical protein KC321_g10703 [Hortaea werneckii]